MSKVKPTLDTEGVFEAFEDLGGAAITYSEDAGYENAAALREAAMAFAAAVNARQRD